MLVIDLCSGLGGFSQAFLDRGHNVVRVDNNSKFKDVPNTIIADVRYIRELNLPQPDILLMSPPCNHFSIATNSRYWNKEGIPKHKDVIESIRIVFWCLDAVDYLEPKYWLLENPRGRLRHILGKPSATTFFASFGDLQLKPTDIWGNIPLNMEFPKPKDWAKSPGSYKKGVQTLQKHKDKRVRAPEIRAKIPYKLSEALCKATEMVINK